LTTKKSKPASLTSSLLARKGEAEPAAAPYSIPESGRERPADSMVGKGNGNGGDLGHGLTGMPRLSEGEHEAKPVVSDNGTPSPAVSPPEPQPARVVPPAAPRIEISETAAESAEAAKTEPEQPEAAHPEEVAGKTTEKTPEETPAEESAEEVFLESTVAEEASVDEAVIEASMPPSESPEPEAPADADATVAETKPGGTDGTGSDDGTADREAVRDARLLRFVYVMAALTGIVAIVLYAGGWLRQESKTGAPEEAVASKSETGTPEITAKTVPPPAAVEKPAASDSSSAIPPAPPEAASAAAGAKPAAPETAVTTGGPPKSQADTTMPAPTGTETAAAASGDTGTAAEAPATEAAKPGESQQAAMPDKPAAPAATATAGGEAGKSAGTSVAAEQPSAPKAAAPKVAAPKVTAPPAPTKESSAAGGKAVRDVPNMRVLAPALMKPKPADTAPPPASETGSVPAVTAPAVGRTASVPKAKPPAPAPTHAAANGRYFIQLASVGSEKVAAREWTRLQKRFPDILGARELVIEKKELAGRGTFYRVQSGGFESLREARTVCNALKSKKQACLPIKR
jgi:hypothetical protein